LARVSLAGGLQTIALVNMRGNGETAGSLDGKLHDLAVDVRRSPELWIAARRTWSAMPSAIGLLAVGGEDGPPACAVWTLLAAGAHRTLKTTGRHVSTTLSKPSERQDDCVNVLGARLALDGHRRIENTAARRVMAGGHQSRASRDQPGCGASRKVGCRRAPFS